MQSKATTRAVPPAILRIAAVIQLVGLSRTTLWRLEKAGKFPRKVRLSERLVGYHTAAVHRWIEEREGA